MASESFQYRALFEYQRERGDDIGLQPGDLLTVAKSSLVQAGRPAYQEGDERSPKGWLHGTNERTKETGDFPGTFVEYVGVVVVRPAPPATATATATTPRTPGGPQAAAGPQLLGGAATSEDSSCQPDLLGSTQRIQLLITTVGRKGAVAACYRQAPFSLT
ncbi:hypothetical protein NHX12_033010, partial [Muraenolepis orangiensis]